MENLSFTDKITDKEISSKESLEEIIQLIKSDRYQSICNQISTAEKTIATKLKQNHLPIFNPCVRLENYRKFGSNNNNESTGIIQFDIDECNEYATLIKDVKKIPELLYLFRSPSGGLKFGIKTDFISNEQTFIKEGFKHAYKIAKTHAFNYADFITDDSVSSIAQSCFVSYDPDAFLNLNAEELAVKEEVENILIELEVNHNQRKDSLFFGTSSNVDKSEVERALEYIPKNFRYDERFRINFAVISAYGDQAFDILFNHWHHDEPEKLKKQINTQIKEFNGEIGIGTLFKTASSFGFKTASTNKRSQSSNNPPLFDQTIYSLNDAQDKLSAEIDDFFDNGTSKLINFEAGAGKTKICIERAYAHINKIHTKANSNGKRPKIAIFVANHVLAEQYANDFKKQIEQLNALPADASPSRKKRNNSYYKELRFKYDIRHIKGRNAEGMCNHDLKIHINNEQNESEKNRLKNLFNTHQSKLCHKCHKALHCDYVQQFNDPVLPDENEATKTSIRIYTHDQLFNGRSLWDNGSYDEFDGIVTHPVEHDWEPSHLIIDEDIVGKALNKNTYFEETQYGEASSLLQNIMHEMKTAPLAKVVAKFSANIIAAHEEQCKKIKEWQKPTLIKQIDSVETIISKLSDKPPPREFKVIGALNKFAKRLAVNDNNIETNYRAIYLDSKKNTLCFADRGYIHERYEDIPTLLLDASANELIIKSIFGEPLQFESFSIKYQNNVKIFQCENNTYSKQNLKEEGQILDHLKKYINAKSQNKSFGLITYQHLHPHDKFGQTLANDTGAKEYSYFGNLRGINKFEKLDQLFVIGRHDFGQALEVHFKQLFCGLKDENKEVNLEQNILVQNVYRMKSGCNRHNYERSYSDARMVALQQHLLKAETYQAIHRLRLIHGNKPKEVHVFTSQVLDITINDLFRTKKGKPVTNKYIELIQNHIIEKGFLHNKNNAICEATGISASTMKNLKRKEFNDRILDNSNIALYEIEGTNEMKRHLKLPYFVYQNDTSILKLNIKGFDIIKYVKV